MLITVLLQCIGYQRRALEQRYLFRDMSVFDDWEYSATTKIGGIIISWVTVHGRRNYSFFTYLIIASFMTSPKSLCAPHFTTILVP